MRSEEIKQQIIDSFNEKKLSHAFLIETNNLDKCLEDCIDIIRIINCENKGKENCTCKICRTIKSNNNPDIVVIKPDGRDIKDIQISELLHQFITKPLINKYQSYIIYSADKIYGKSANKMLKFVEEPDENTIGFFITENKHAVINTIKSRCSIYNFKYGETNILSLLEINEEEYDKYFNIASEFINRITTDEKFKVLQFASTLKSYERVDLLKIMNIVKKIYEVKFNSLMYNDHTEEYVNIILSLVDKETKTSVVKRLKLLDNTCNDLKGNPNKELCLDKLILMWE